MKVNITNEVVRRAKPESKPYEIRDSRLKGLILRVQPTGVMTYYIEYQRGKRLRIGGADVLTPDLARTQAKGELVKVYQGKDPRKPKVATYLDFLNSTYKPWLELNLVHGGYAYDTLVRRFEELHSLKLNEINKQAIEEWKTRQLAKGANPNTINRHLSDLKAFLNRAHEIWGVKLSDELGRIRPYKIDRSPKVRYLSADEETKLRKALDEREERIKTGRERGNQWRAERGHELVTDLRDLPFADYLKPAVLLSLNTGLRRGELLKLKWEEVSFEKSRLTVIGKTSKTGKTRHVQLNAEALSVLKQWKEQWKEQQVKGPYVFTGLDGQPLHDMRTSWEGVLDKAKIKNFRWHDMRHTFASNLVMAGVNLNDVRDLLGHSDYKMTLRYAHLAPETQQAAVDKLVKVQA